MYSLHLLHAEFYNYFYCMSKRELKTYLSSLKKRELEAQIEDLYARFKDVKEYYDFAFNPREEKLLEKSKFDISKEYFPVGKRKAKKRRSVAQKYIKHYIRLGVDAWVVGEIMLYNIEIAQSYVAENTIKQDAFYVSMLKSYEEALKFVLENGLKAEFASRLKAICDETWTQNWFNKTAFERLLITFNENIQA